MKKYLWIGAAVLLAVAAAAIFFAFQRPDFVAGLMAAAIGALIKASWPGLKVLFRRKTPTEEAKDWARSRRGEPAKKRRPGSGGKNG